MTAGGARQEFILRGGSRPGRICRRRLVIFPVSGMLALVLEGWRIAPGASRGRKVRTPLGAMPRNPSLFDWDTRGRSAVRLADGKCHRKLDRHRRKPVVRVKRCGKSAPRGAQATRHGKPHRVQGQIGNRGAARSAWRESAAGFGYRSLRQMILSAARRRQNSAYSPSKTNSPFRRRQKDECRMMKLMLCKNTSAYLLLQFHRPARGVRRQIHFRRPNRRLA